MTDRPLLRRRLLAAFSAAMVIAFAAHVAHSLLGYGSGGANGLASDALYDVVVFSAGGITLARGVLVAEDRPVWLLVGAGTLAWAIGELYATLASPGREILATPSPADGFYLAFYPAVYAGLLLLLRNHVRRFPPSVWLDGAIEGLAVAAVATAALSHPILNHAHGGAGQVATDLVYPLADLVLLSLVVTAFAMSRWRPGRGFALLGGALVVTAGADAWYAYAKAANIYVDGQPLDSLWLFGGLLIAWAAWASAREPASPWHRRAATPRPSPTEPSELQRWPVLWVPIACAVAALGLLVSDHFTRLVSLALALAAATLMAAIARMALSFLENRRFLMAAERQAVTDALTGLPNRRSLLDDLDEQLQARSRTSPSVLAVFDLDGFKHYNDTFGHQLGDALLARLGRLLAVVVEGSGGAYRLGGDEFCVIVRRAVTAGREPRATPAEVRALVAPAAVALSSAGGGFDVGCSFGAVAVPEEATTAPAALQLADRRMYAHKASKYEGGLERRGTWSPVDLLPRRQPPIAAGLGDVTELSVAVGRRLGMASRDLDVLADAASRRDIGKDAVPDDLLAKAGDLEPGELAFMHLHPVAGERVLAAQPILRSAAVLVRSSHERFDGAGYPDGLDGDAIPLGSRIIFACDTLGSLVSGRPHRPAMALDRALAELEADRGAGFDPRVIDALVEELQPVLRPSARAGRITS